jgi:choice-of-anchor C domain-containing protein
MLVHHWVIRVFSSLSFVAATASFWVSPLLKGESTNLLSNGSFELGDDPEISVQLDDGSSESALPGWKIEGNLDYINKRWRASDGRRSIDLNGVSRGQISQVISNLIVGRRYQLSFALAPNPEDPPPLTRLVVSVGGVSNRFTMVEGGSMSRPKWTKRHLEFIARSNATEVRFTSHNSRWSGPVLDDIRVRLLPEPVPDPQAVIVADVARDFSTNANPNGPWRDGWKTRLESRLMLLANARWWEDPKGEATFTWRFNPYEWPAVMAVNVHGRAREGSDEFFARPGSVILAPGTTDAPEDHGVVRYVMSLPAGNYRVESMATSSCGRSIQGDTEFQILTNDVQVFGLLLAPHQSAGFTNDMHLGPGVVIDFVVGRGWDQKHQGSVIGVEARILRLSKPD